MPDRIDPVLVEKARDVFNDVFYAEIPQDAIRPTDEAMEATLRVVSDELGLKELYDALRLLAAVSYDEALISDTLEVEYDDLFERKLLAQSRDITDEYTSHLTGEGYELVVTQLKRHWRPVEQEKE